MKNVLPLTLKKYEAKHYMKYLLSLGNNVGNSLSIASYCSKRSALSHLYRLYEIKPSEKFMMELGTMFKGLKRKVALEQQSGIGRIQTGKSAVSFSLYCRINEYMLAEDTMESIFARAFLNMTWNLCCRATNTCSIHLHHIEWADDSLCVYFAHMKNDQVGDRKRDPRHIYANPNNPIVCPVLSLAIYLSVFSISGTKNSALFPGSNQYKRFSKYFEMILWKHKDEIIAEFGIDVKNIGINSLRKGSTSFISSGSTCAPPPSCNHHSCWLDNGGDTRHLPQI